MTIVKKLYQVRAGSGRAFNIEIDTRSWEVALIRAESVMEERSKWTSQWVSLIEYAPYRVVARWEQVSGDVWQGPSLLEAAANVTQED